jgi:hypothetical protein
MIIEINLKNLKYKIFISIIVVSLFYVMYCTVPDSEFGRNDKTIHQMSSFDRINFTLEKQFLISSSNSIYPYTDRAKSLTICHSLIAWCIFIL